MSHQRELIRHVARLRAGWHARDLTDFALLPGGYSNRNYRFLHRDARYVLRIPGHRRPFVDRELEWAFYRAPGRVRVPEIEAFEPATGVMISRWEAGELLCDRPPDPSALVPYLATLHQGLCPSPRIYDPIALSREYLALGEPPAEILALARATRWSPPETTACHNDLNPWNIIRSGDATPERAPEPTPERAPEPTSESAPEPNAKSAPEPGAEAAAARDTESAAATPGWVTLDWEWFGANDPVFDLVTLHQGLVLDDAILADLAGELLGRSGSPIRARVGRCLTAFWLREYAWAHAELVRGNDRDEIREQVCVAGEKLGSL